MMIAMQNGDDLDARFNELVAQFDADEQRKMRASATRGVKAPGRTRRGLLAVAGVMAVIAAAGAVVVFRPDLLGPPSRVTGPVPEETQAVVIAEPEADRTGAGRAETPADPFEGSPASAYADGATGFTMPKAKARGGLSKKDVAKALDRTRALLAAAYLDHKTLMGGKPKAFIERLESRQRDWFRDRLDLKWKKSRFDARYWVNSFAPKTAELATDVIKVHGASTVKPLAKKYGRQGVEVATKYLLVYAVQRPGQPATARRLVTRVEGVVLVYRESGRLVTWVDKWGRVSSTPARCDVKDAFMHPIYQDSEPDTTSVRATDPPADPYDLDHERSRDGKCRRGLRP
jgi:hypothetical protein